MGWEMFSNPPASGLFEGIKWTLTLRPKGFDYDSGLRGLRFRALRFGAGFRVGLQSANFRCEPGCLTNRDSDAPNLRNYDPLVVVWYSTRLLNLRVEVT